MAVHTDAHGWILETDSTAYALGLNETGLLTHRYWGVRLPRQQDYPPAPNPAGWASFDSPAHLTPEEYPAYGDMKFIEPCLKATFADGVRNVILQFVAATAGSDELHIEMRDAHYGLRLTLHYRIHAAYDLIERRVSLTNSGDTAITIERIWSAQWHLPPGAACRLTHLTGRWGSEFNLCREPLTRGVKMLESRGLTTGHHHNPWFAIDRGTADEDYGEVWFGALGWSGNWQMAGEVTDFDAVRISLGISDWDFAWRLEPGQTFVTPPAYAGYTTAGFGGASRRLHAFIRDCLLPHGRALHKVLYNSWEANYFNVDEASQMETAQAAAEIGIELFVIDDGWFRRRMLDTAGLGDWWPDENKFPRGLQPLIARVNELGMDFGLWIEPEMVNPDSDLYRAHPDWVLHFPGRPRTEARNQLILNLARPDVQDHLIAQLDRLLTENNIAFVKWDMNRNVSEPGWPAAPGEQREVWVRYVHGLYRVWQTLRERHPQVVWQSCSGGGGRADPGILRLADQVWISDTTEAAARLSIQEGYSYAFPAATMEAWVTDVLHDRRSLDFRFHVSMCGVLGISGQLARWTPAQKAQAKKWIALYKEIRPIVQLGDLYRLRSPQAHAFSALQYVSADKSEGVLFAFRTYLPDPVQLPPLRLRGLDPQAVYAVEGEADARSGLAWMQTGLRLDLNNFQSAIRRIRRI